jgi:hypothetical protein
MATDTSLSYGRQGFVIKASPDDNPFPMMSTEALEDLAGQLGNVSTADFTSAFQNLFQAIYHLFRMDLGVIVDNQIYNSPQMFNLSIMPVNLLADFGSSFADDSRAVTSNSSLMAQWRQRVAFFQTSDRVPVMDYLRPVPRLKPLGSAITSVFVSTFAMLSALWTIFPLGAGALARRTGQFPSEYIYFIASRKNLEAPPRQRLSVHADSEETNSGKSGRFASQRFGVYLHAKDSGWDMGTSTSFAFHKEPAPTHIRLEHLEDDVGGMKHEIGGMKHDIGGIKNDMREMKYMVRLLLEKQGLADDRLDHDFKGVRLSLIDIPEAFQLMHIVSADLKEETLSPLVYRRSTSSDWT